jgi:putative membrane protein
MGGGWLLWFKALHLISMVAWFAGLFYLFRLFVYHAENREQAVVVALLKTMAYRLYFYITWPAMVGTLFFGFGLLAINPGYLQFGWMRAKLALVLCLVIYHFFCGGVRRRFQHDQVFLSSRACRLLNEVPTPLLIGIILLAVLRP